MLARALALEPRVLLLDEPTSALDQAARDAVEGTLRRLRARTAISIVVSPMTSPRPGGSPTTWCGSNRQRSAQGPAAEVLAGGRARDRHCGGRDVIVAASSINVTLGEVAAALALVAIAAIASRAWHAGLEEDIGIAVVRSLIQLTAIGYVITRDLRPGLGRARARADHRDGRLRRLHGPASRQVGAERLLATAHRARSGGRGDARPGDRPWHLPGDPALSGAGRGHGDRQLDDVRGSGPQPARRGRPRSVRARSRRPSPSARRRRRPSHRWSSAACARG